MDSVFQSHDADNYLQLVAGLSERQFVERISREHQVIISTPLIGFCPNFGLKCWEFSRVRLADSGRDAEFIHANYVSGFDGEKGFVLTQEPLDQSLEIYWLMIWREGTQVIVMLNCDDDRRASKTFSALRNFSISVVQMNIHQFYIETVMRLCNEDIKRYREVRHFKFLNWPKGCVVDVSALIEFLAVANKTHRNYWKAAVERSELPPGPVVVYSSSGTGRAAAFCALDICLHRLVNSATISVPSVVLGIRRQRHSSLESLDLYFFINNAVVFFLASVPKDSELYDEFRTHSVDEAPMTSVG